MKLLKQNIVRNIVISLLIGGFMAASLTNITYTCAPLPDQVNGGCIAFESAIMHPVDLLNNKQDSLEKFIKTAIVVVCSSFVALHLATLLRHRNRT